jgi:methylenetetrahydrofolate dehydrogenase (NADP+)/methenyltetrahydrofolate cyclohydrolase
MTAQLIDGTALSQRLRADIGRRAVALAATGRRPGLAVILVGDDPASAVYVRNKVRACAEHGLHSVLERYPATLSQDELLARIASLNADQDHGEPRAAAGGRQRRGPAPDVRAQPLRQRLRPCTPWGCMKLIESTGVPLRGRHAVVIGRSNTVGKPMALLLLQADATITVCHSRTPDLGEHTRRADIVVAAVGRRHTVTADMVKPGAVIIDVGMNRDEQGRLCGDVDFGPVREALGPAGFITPVPGGVGPMTITMLLANTLQAAEAGR